MFHEHINQSFACFRSLNVPVQLRQRCVLFILSSSQFRLSVIAPLDYTPVLILFVAFKWTKLRDV